VTLAYLSPRFNCLIPAKLRIFQFQELKDPANHDDYIPKGFIKVNTFLDRLNPDVITVSLPRNMSLIKGLPDRSNLFSTIKN
jgi:hypothetical protein